METVGPSMLSLDKIDPGNWKAILQWLEHHVAAGFRNATEQLNQNDSKRFAFYSESDLDNSDEMGRPRSPLEYIIRPLIDEIAFANGCSHSKACELALDHAAVRSRGIGTADGVRSAYNATLRSPPTLSKNKFCWFLVRGDFDIAAMALQYLAEGDRQEMVKLLMDFSNRIASSK